MCGTGHDVSGFVRYYAAFFSARPYLIGIQEYSVFTAHLDRCRERALYAVIIQPHPLIGQFVVDFKQPVHRLLPLVVLCEQLGHLEELPLLFLGQAATLVVHRHCEIVKGDGGSGGRFYVSISK